VGSKVTTELEALRRKKGWSQLKLAKLAKVSQNTISRIESGDTTKPNTTTSKKLADALGVPISQLSGVADPKRVFFIAAAFMEEWQLELQQNLILAVREEGYSCSIFLPSQTYAWDEHLRAQDEIKRTANDYSGGFVSIPAWGKEKETELMMFATAIDKPIVFLDQNPAIAGADIPRNVSFVAMSDTEGGRIGARAAVQLLGKKKRAKVLVLTGTAKAQRHEQFLRELEAAQIIVESIICKDAGWNRATSQKRAEQHLKAALKNHSSIDLIFCTGDSMTLGAVDAVSAIESWGKHRPVIIGYDGVAEAKRLADLRVIARIVVQDARIVARAATSKFFKLLSNDDKVARIELIDPCLYPSE
jgi:DNA-binding LacI/PurR family transcriptional regulator